MNQIRYRFRYVLSSCAFLRSTEASISEAGLVGFPVHVSDQQNRYRLRKREQFSGRRQTHKASASHVLPKFPPKQERRIFNEKDVQNADASSVASVRRKKTFSNQRGRRRRVFIRQKLETQRRLFDFEHRKFAVIQGVTKVEEKRHHKARPSRHFEPTSAGRCLVQSAPDLCQNRFKIVTKARAVALSSLLNHIIPSILGPNSGSPKS